MRFGAHVLMTILDELCDDTDRVGGIDSEIEGDTLWVRAVTYDEAIDDNVSMPHGDRQRAWLTIALAVADALGWEPDTNTRRLRGDAIALVQR